MAPEYGCDALGLFKISLLYSLTFYPGRSLFVPLPPPAVIAATKAALLTVAALNVV